MPQDSRQANAERFVREVVEQDFRQSIDEDTVRDLAAKVVSSSRRLQPTRRRQEPRHVAAVTCGD